MKDYQITLVQVAPQPIAVVRDTTTLGQLVPRIMKHSETITKFLRGNPEIKSDGHRVAVYYNERDNNLLTTTRGIKVEIGARVLEPFNAAGEVICSTTPAGQAAVTTHVGPYDQLGNAYNSLFAWLKQNHHEGAGPCWEVYGHWNDDPKKLETEVYCLLK